MWLANANCSLETMRLFGKITKKKMLNFNKFACVFFGLLFSINSFARDCESLKTTILESSSYQETDIKELKAGVDADNLCMKNLMGIMIYNGFYFPKDYDRAEDIFSDLANKNYPEAQFNFALVMTKKLDQDPNVITSLLVGIYYKYADDKRNSHLASRAKTLGHKYTESLSDIASVCLDKNTKCSEKMTSLSTSDIQRIQYDFNNLIRDAQFDVASKRLKLTNDTKEQANTLFTILSLGLMVHSLTTPAYSSGSRAQSINGTEVWLDKSFGRRPMHLNTYQFPGTFW